MKHKNIDSLQRMLFLKQNNLEAHVLYTVPLNQNIPRDVTYEFMYVNSMYNHKCLCI